MKGDSRTRAEIAGLGRLVTNMIRTGKVLDIDFEREHPRVRVSDANWKTDWLPWLEARAHEEATWSPPRIGERVMLLAPGGDVDQAIILTGLPCDDYPVPSREKKQSMRRYADGAFLRHDSETHLLELELPPEGMYRITIGPSMLEMDAAGFRLRGPKFRWSKNV